MGSKWQPVHIGLGGTERATIAACDLDCVDLLESSCCWHRSARTRHEGVADVAVRHSARRLDGDAGVLADEKGKVTLLVNVASFCGLTPQYEGLEELHEKYGARASRSSASRATSSARRSRARADEIKTFCSTSYGVTFPLTEKIEVNGDGRHPLYQQLTQTADAEGHTGDIRWNFEKFLIGRDGEIVARFSPLVEPANDELVGAIEKALAG